MSGTIAERIGGAPQPQARSQDERPPYLLSLRLLETYKCINERYYRAKRREAAKGSKLFNDGYDDEHGNYVVQEGEEIIGRFVVQKVLGKGSFGVVVQARDHKKCEQVALKVIKNKPQFQTQAKVEIDILVKMMEKCKDEHNIVQLKKYFPWKNHLCLSFELLSFNLYDLIKYTKFQGVSINLVRKFAYQILKSLEFLRDSAIQVIHCDLKPENILLRNPKRSSIKVVDFGSSCYVHKKMFKYIQSRFYRAPEVILGHSYTTAIDMWSLGCILVEMHTGTPIFDGKDEGDQLGKMHAVCGALPLHMVEAAAQKKKLQFFPGGATGLRFVSGPPQPRPLDRVLGTETGGPSGRRQGTPGHEPESYRLYVDLIAKMLVYDPKERITPAAALDHKFVRIHSDTLRAPEGAAKHFDPAAEPGSRPDQKAAPVPAAPM